MSVGELGPRFSSKMRNDVTVTYDTCLYATDEGMWTVYEIVKRPVAKVADEQSAKKLMALMHKGGGL